MTVNVAMIATGRIADQALAPALAATEGAQLWSVLSRDAARAREFAARHGAAAKTPVHTDLDTLLSDPELHAVIIASPDKLHAGQVIAAARAGKHVLVEKPMATEVADAEAMVEACDRAGVKLAVAYHLRWHAGHRQALELVRAGALGTLRHMRVQWTFLAPDARNWRASPEVGRWWGLAGVGTHCLDQVRWFMLPSSGEVEEQRSIISHAAFGTAHDETAVVAMRFEAGSTAEICTSVMFNAPKRMEIYGSEGHIICDDTLGPHGAGTILVNGEPMEFAPVDPYVGEIVDFVAAIRDDRAPEVDGREGARNVAQLVAAA